MRFAIGIVSIVQQHPIRSVRVVEQTHLLSYAHHYQSNTDHMYDNKERNNRRSAETPSPSTWDSPS